MTMLYRYFRTRSDAVQSDNSATLSGFADGGTVNSWAAEALGWAVERGIVRGRKGNRIDPQGTATGRKPQPCSSGFCCWNREKAK